MNEIYFSNLAVEAGTCDVETTKKIYYALIRQIVQAAGKGHDYICPDFGSFTVYEHKGRRIKNVNTGEHSFVEPFYKIKFTPSEQLRKYIIRKNQII